MLQAPAIDHNEKTDLLGKSDRLGPKPFQTAFLGVGLGLARGTLLKVPLAYKERNSCESSSRPPPRPTVITQLVGSCKQDWLQ